jgi:hypothetical protein
MTHEHLNKIDTCRHLLAEPAPEVVGELVAELRRYMAALDAVEDALEQIIAMNRQTAYDKYGDAERAESWSCVAVARAALSRGRVMPNK